MKKKFVPYYLAVQLRDLGFDEECLGSFTIEDNSLQIVDMYNLPSVVKAPLWQQAFDWLFKEFNFWQYTFPNAHNKDWCYHIQWYKESFGWGESFIQNGFKTQEEARLACLEKLIEICGTL